MLVNELMFTDPFWVAHLHHACHPYFFEELFNKNSIIGIATDLLYGGGRTSTITHESSPGALDTPSGQKPKMGQNMDGVLHQESIYQDLTDVDHPLQPFETCLGRRPPPVREICRVGCWQRPRGLPAPNDLRADLRAAVQSRGTGPSQSWPRLRGWSVQSLAWPRLSLKKV